MLLNFNSIYHTGYNLQFKKIIGHIRLPGDIIVVQKFAITDKIINLEFDIIILAFN